MISHDSLGINSVFLSVCTHSVKAAGGTYVCLHKQCLGTQLGCSVRAKVSCDHAELSVVQLKNGLLIDCGFI